MTEENVKEVIKRVKQKLDKYSWFKGVNLDEIRELDDNQINEAVEIATYNTIYWDAPNNGF
jgi:hypothetical protein